MMATLDKASPKLCTKILRRLRSLWPLIKDSVIPPLTASAASDVQIIQLSATTTGLRSRSIASYPSQSASTIRSTAFVNAARVPAR